MKASGADSDLLVRVVGALATVRAAPSLLPVLAPRSHSLSSEPNSGSVESPAAISWKGR